MSVSGTNCAGNGQPSMDITQTIIAEAPLVPRITRSSIDNQLDNFATITLQWEPNENIDNCLQPPITNYSIVVSGVQRYEFFVNPPLTNTVLSVPACGTSAVTISSINSVGRSDRSDPLIFSGSPLTLFASVTKLGSDVATINVVTSECLRPAVDNVTVIYSSNILDVIYNVSTTYPNDSLSVDIELTNLQQLTDYNTTVIVYYRDDGTVKTLGPQQLSFTTSQSFSYFMEAVIAGLTAGFGISLIVIVILIILICKYYTVISTLQIHVLWNYKSNSVIIYLS
jgi:hypothetical protein